MPPVAQLVEQRFRNIPISIDWDGFRTYLLNKYRQRHWALELFRNARRYQHLMGNLSLLDSFSKTKKLHVLQSLIALSKYCGFYEELKARIKAFGIKWHKPNSLMAFLRILDNSNSDVLQWLKRVSSVLDENSKTFLEFALCSGLRAVECIESFNLIIRLREENKLHDYYNEALSTLEHFRFPKIFLRNTKNVFISMVPSELISKIVRCKPITYDSVKMKLQRKHLPLRINDLRDYHGSFMVRHGLIREEVDLLQGRVSDSIFVRHYFSPAMNELRDRTLKGIEPLQQELLALLS